MRFKATMITRFTCLNLCLLTMGGCSDLPRIYQTIELGKPLDNSVLPVSAHRNKPDSNESSVTLQNQEKSLLPLGFRECRLDISLDKHKNVTRLRLEDSHSYSWIFAVSCDVVTKERFLDTSGKPQESDIKNKSTVTPFWSGDFAKCSYVLLMSFSQPGPIEG